MGCFEREIVDKRVSALLGLWVLSACSGAPDAPTSRCEGISWDGAQRQPNLVVIVNDTMRRDRTGAYGGVAETPAFDAFANEGLLFQQAYTQAPWTKPAIATLFTGRYPSEHGLATHPVSERVQGNPVTDVLDPDFVTLAEVLSRAGYRTGAIVSNPWMARGFGFEQGFGSFMDHFSGWGASGEDVTAAALEWIGATRGERPYFLYVHYLDTHQPYPSVSIRELEESYLDLVMDDRPLPGPARRKIRELVRFVKQDEGADDPSGRPGGILPTRALLDLAYNQGIEAFDRALGPLLDALADRTSDTAVVITSDHGEALFERGYWNHGRGLYDDEIAIPLAMNLPGVSRRKEEIDCLVGLVDLMPTLCTYLDADCPQSLSGLSLLSRGDAGFRGTLMSEGVVAEPDHRAVRDADFKLLFEPGVRPDRRATRNPYSLYRVGVDPAESVDLLQRELSPDAAHAFDRLRQALESGTPTRTPSVAAPRPLDSRLVRRLAELGYLDDTESQADESVQRVRGHVQSSRER